MLWPKPLLRDNPHVSKKDFGHVLVVAGSAQMLGAAALVGLAAMRSGAGMITCAIPFKLNLTLQKKISSAIMTLPFKSLNDIKKHFDKFNALAIGPGLGQSTITQKLVPQLLLSFNGPVVIDADALNILSKSIRNLRRNLQSSIITPHVGEMSRLTLLPLDYIEKNRKSVALDFAKKYNCIVVLKGHETIVATSSEVFVNKSGNSGLSKAGMGDVLTGMIAALLAQGVSPFEAACFAVNWHGSIGDKLLVSQARFSILATDMIEQLKRQKF